jgi:nitroreductase
MQHRTVQEATTQQVSTVRPDTPPGGLDAAGLDQLLSAATAAPSVHNTQPWRYHLLPDGHTIDVRAVPERAPRAIDPSGRALHVSVGAALVNLRTAAEHLGWEARVRPLPSAAQPQLLARIRLARLRRPAVGHGPDLFDSVRHRHGGRQASVHRPVPAIVLAELVEAAHVEGARLATLDPAETARVLALTAEAERRNLADPLRSAESRSWSHRHQDGPLGTVPALLEPAGRPGTGPLTLVLGTAHDRRADWLRAGQAMQHVLLLATAHRVRCSLPHQPVEWPDLRLALRQAHHGPGHVQMVLRLGDGPVTPAGPRAAPTAPTG